MKPETLIKLDDMCNGSPFDRVSLVCKGIDDSRCVMGVCSGCQYMACPRTCLDDLIRHIDRNKPVDCIMPLDDILDRLKAI